MDYDDVYELEYKQFIVLGIGCLLFIVLEGIFFYYFGCVSWGLSCDSIDD